jgi:hypothetical protein
MPIELAFYTAKAWLKRNDAWVGTVTPFVALDAAFSSISHDAALGFIRAPGI